jgi:LmbE family N-acetylglucosaminyl deacetylase
MAKLMRIKAELTSSLGRAPADAELVEECALELEILMASRPARSQARAVLRAHGMEETTVLTLLPLCYVRRQKGVWAYMSRPAQNAVRRVSEDLSTEAIWWTEERASSAADAIMAHYAAAAASSRSGNLTRLRKILGDIGVSNVVLNATRRAKERRL